MRTNHVPLTYPVACAQNGARSFVASVEIYRSALEANNFDVMEKIDERDIALELFSNTKARLAQCVPPPLGLHILMDKEASRKVASMFANI